MSNRLSDDDIDRIARRVVGRLVLYALIAIVALWVVPFVMFTVVATVSASTQNIPGGQWIALPLIVSLIAGPAVLFIWLWGRSRRAR